jgi:hypothetical protein
LLKYGADPKVIDFNDKKIMNKIAELNARNDKPSELFKENKRNN